MHSSRMRTARSSSRPGGVAKLITRTSSFHFRKLTRCRKQQSTFVLSLLKEQIQVPYKVATTLLRDLSPVFLAEPEQRER